MDILLETDIGEDPDDFIALNILLANPNVELKGIMITPGYKDQVVLVKKILAMHGRNEIPIGAPRKQLGNGKHAVNDRHLKCMQWLNSPIDANEISKTNIDDVREGWDLFEDLAKQFSNLVYISISPLRNFHMWIDNGTQTLQQSYSMGGYIGDQQLAQPKTLPEFNFGGDVGGSHRLMTSERIRRKVFVSKNITHCVVYDAELHEQVQKVAAQGSIGHRLIATMMDSTQGKNTFNKFLHDPLTVCVALNESIVQLHEVKPYKEAGEYGAWEQVGTGYWISYGNVNHINKAEFWRIFLEWKK